VVCVSGGRHVQCQGQPAFQLGGYAELQWLYKSLCERLSVTRTTWSSVMFPPAAYSNCALQVKGSNHILSAEELPQAQHP